MNTTTSFVGAVALALVSSAHGAVIYSSGQISHITDVAVTAVNADWGSTGPGDPRTVHFTVDFLYGSFIDVFGVGALPADWEFDSLGLATAATFGLAEALAGEPATALFTGGLSEPMVPYYVGEVSGSSGSCPNCVLARSVFFWPPPHTVGWAPTNATSTLQLGDERSWAVFQRSAVVPLPAAFWLLGSGLALVVGAAGRKRKNDL